MSAYFISSNLPKNYSKEEEKQLLQRIRTGDRKARDLFIVSNIRLVLNQVLNHFDGTNEEIQELVSEGIVGLIKAVDTFDMTKKYSFSTYAARCIRNEILMFLRKNRKKILLIPLDDYLSSDLGCKDLVLEDIISSDINIEEEYIFKDMICHVKSAFQLLNEQEQQVIGLYFGLYGNKRYTQEELAKLFHVKRGQIIKIMTCALEQMKKEILGDQVKQRVKK